MDELLKSICPPKEKTLTERCGEYIKENPTTVAKGAVVGIAAWYTVPVIVTGIAWLPVIGAGYLVYSNARTTQQTYSWYKWIKDRVIS